MSKLTKNNKIESLSEIRINLIPLDNNQFGIASEFNSIKKLLIEKNKYMVLCETSKNNGLCGGEVKKLDSQDKLLDCVKALYSDLGRTVFNSSEMGSHVETKFDQDGYLLSMKVYDFNLPIREEQTRFKCLSWNYDKDINDRFRDINILDYHGDIIVNGVTPLYQTKMINSNTSYDEVAIIPLLRVDPLSLIFLSTLFPDVGKKKSPRLSIETEHQLKDVITSSILSWGDYNLKRYPELRFVELLRAYYENPKSLDEITWREFIFYLTVTKNDDEWKVDPDFIRVLLQKSSYAYNAINLSLALAFSSNPRYFSSRIFMFGLSERVSLNIKFPVRDKTAKLSLFEYPSLVIQSLSESNVFDQMREPYLWCDYCVQRIGLCKPKMPVYSNSVYPDGFTPSRSLYKYALDYEPVSPKLLDYYLIMKGSFLFENFVIIRPYSNLIFDEMQRNLKRKEGSEDLYKILISLNLIKDHQCWTGIPYVMDQFYRLTWDGKNLTAFMPE